MSVFTPHEEQLVEAIAARIFPTTDTPGAAEAAAVSYIDRALADAYHQWLPHYQRGLRALERYARASFGHPLLQLSEPEQDLVLAGLESGSAGPGAAEFFQLVRRHVLEGVFCEPDYGGNRDLIGWRLVGFPGQQHGYADPFINRTVEIPPTAARGIAGEEE
jgi:gluconate 2-dehydrogenase gamma chain